MLKVVVTLEVPGTPRALRNGGENHLPFLLKNMDEIGMKLRDYKTAIIKNYLNSTLHMQMPMARMRPKS